MQNPDIAALRVTNETRVTAVVVGILIDWLNTAITGYEALRRVATIESIGSSTRIEGCKLSDAEVESLFALIGTQSFASRDEQEVVGNAEVMETVFQSYSDIAITENHLLQLHAMLLRHSTKDERHRGATRLSATMQRPLIAKLRALVWSSKQPRHSIRHAKCRTC